jgi:hypothetical protein
MMSSNLANLTQSKGYMNNKQIEKLTQMLHKYKWNTV